MLDHAKYIQRSLELAQKAAEEKEVPVGALIVCKGQIIAEAYNKKEQGKNALYHAEILAITEASKKLGQWRLSECDLYTSLEPCLMCAGAIISSRISKVIFAATDTKGGAFGSVYSVHNDGKLNHSPQVYSEPIEKFSEESKKILQEFFKTQRIESKEAKKSKRRQVIL